MSRPPSPPSVTLSFRRRAAIIATAVAINGALYLAINARDAAPSIGVMVTGIDRALGFHAWTIWPYWLLLSLAPAMALAIGERSLFAATLRAYVVALTMNALLWVLVPTRLPRAPLPAGLDAATSAAWRLLHAVDAPGNCFPSGHVTLPIVIAAGFALQHPRMARLAWIAIAALLPSVITTGQHVALDVLGGAATASMGLALTRHPILRRRAEALTPAG